MECNCGIGQVLRAVVLEYYLGIIPQTEHRSDIKTQACLALVSAIARSSDGTDKSPGQLAVMPEETIDGLFLPSMPLPGVPPPPPRPPDTLPRSVRNAARAAIVRHAIP
jgi:hypothetical protein